MDRIFQIATFDWSSKAYTIHQSRLKKGQWLGSCSILKDNFGTALVAAAAGEYSSGLEIWNPQDGSVTELANFASDQKLRHSQLLPINHQSDLLLYGGHSGVIWKYTYASNIWEEIGKLIGTKSNSVALPVGNMKCPQNSTD
jgi:hypothetical protein